MTHVIERCNELAASWWPWMFHGAWQAALVATVLLMLVAWGRRWPAPVRYALLLVALGKFAVPPLLGFPTGVFSQVAWMPAAGAQVPADVAPLEERSHPGQGLATEGESVPVGGAPFRWSAASGTGQVGSPAPSPPRASVPPLSGTPRLAALNWKAWLLVGYLTGVVAMLAWLLVQSLNLRRLTRHARPVTEGELWRQYATLAKRLGLRRTPRLLVTAGDTPPFSYGILRPAVVISQATCEELSRQERETVLLHELGHHRRADLWANWVQLLLCTLWWFHPLVWLVGRSLRALREDCCDDYLLAEKLVPAADYCGVLLRVAGGPTTAHRPMVLAMDGHFHPLAHRLRRIMDDAVPRRGRLSWWALGLVVLLAALALPGLQRSRAQEAPAQAAAPKQPSAPATPETTTPASEPGRVITGTVVDEADRPLAEADVWLCAMGRDWKEKSVHVMTNPQGGFRLEVPAEMRLGPGGSELAVVACKEGYQIAAATSPTPKSLFVRPQTLRLAAASSGVKLEVVDPEGRPVAGAHVDARYTRRAGLVPSYRRERAVGTTDAQGCMTLPGVAREDLTYLAIDSPAFGYQQFSARSEAAPLPERIVLAPVGRVRGRLVADAGVPLAGHRLQVLSSDASAEPTPSTSNQPSVSGFAEVQTDAQGRFEVAALCEGLLTLTTVTSNEEHYVIVPTTDQLVVAGQATDVELRLQKAVRVFGRVFEENSHAPIPGVGVYLTAGRQGVGAVTDSQGRFSGWVSPGEKTIRVIALPPFLPTGNTLQSFTVPQDKPEYEYPTVTLVRSVPLSGRTVDAKGKPVADVQVRARWQIAQNPIGRDSQSDAVSDREGRFTLPDVHPTAELTLRVFDHGIPISEPQKVLANRQEPIVLVVRPLEWVALSGRILDPNGKPAASIPYQVRTYTDAGPFVMAYADAIGLTDAEGRFRTSTSFAKIATHDVQVILDGVVVGQSDPLTPSEAGSPTFPDLKLRPVTTDPKSPQAAPASEPRPRGSMPRPAEADPK